MITALPNGDGCWRRVLHPGGNTRHIARWDGTNWHDVGAVTGLGGSSFYLRSAGDVPTVMCWQRAGLSAWNGANRIAQGRNCLSPLPGSQ
jgi:hypothetical protein